MDEKSVWKKEISFRRKPKEPKEPAEQIEPQEPPPTGEPAAEAKSLWKKEISFRRAPKTKTDAPAEPEKTAAAPKQSLWKKEISFGRKRVSEPDAADSSAPAIEPVAPPQEDVVQLPIAAAPEPGPDVQPTPELAAESMLDEHEQIAVPEPAAVFPPEPLPPIQVEPDPPDAWTALPSLSPEPPAVPEEVETVTPSDVVIPAPPLVPADVVLPARPVPPEEATFELPAEPVPVPAPVVHPPVPAAQLPPPEPKADKPAKPVPFWKREIALGRRGDKPKAGRSEELPKQAGEPKPKRQKREKRAKVRVDRGSRGGKKLVGLKVGASQLAAARVSNNGSAELLQVAREPLSPGIVVGGELRDPEALALALADFFAKHKLPKRGVRLGIANNRIGVRTFDVSGIQDQKLLDNAIRFRAQEALPIPIDEAVLDYQVLDESTDPEGTVVRRILLVVAYREQIDRYVDACKKAGIQLVGIDLEAFALLRALQAPIENPGEDASALVGVAIGHERSTFAVSDGRVCEFTRVLDWGGSALNVALARALDAAPSEVEAVKHNLSLVEDSVPEGLTAEQAEKARDAVRRLVQSFARELVSSLQFYQNQPGSLGIGEIVVTGGTAQLPGLAVELERMIGVRVRVGDPLARIKVSKKVGEPQQIGSLAVAIGLGIED